MLEPQVNGSNLFPGFSGVFVKYDLIGSPSAFERQTIEIGFPNNESRTKITTLFPKRPVTGIAKFCNSLVITKMRVTLAET